MIRNVTKHEIEGTKSLDEAVRLMFGISQQSRTIIYPQEQMAGNLARDYDRLGAENRQETYRRIAIDFRTRGSSYSDGTAPGTILDIGCGSGLLSFELARETNLKVQGIDLSSDMITLAKKRLETQEKRIRDSTSFEVRDIYDISGLQGIKDVNYMICRNVLHRLKRPQEAVYSLYKSLGNGGKIYIRDVKRDADWQIILDRINKRWANPELVRDYIGAMAQMFTISEIKSMLEELDIKNYVLTNGEYQHEPSLDVQAEIQDCKPSLNEHEKETEYVCVITKNENSK